MASSILTNALKTPLFTVGGQTLLGGFALTPYNCGTISSGTFTPNPANGNYQYITFNGTFTFAAPTVDCAIDFLVTNGPSSPAPTMSGYTYAAGGYGDPYVATNGAKFIWSIRRINAIATFLFKALQ